MLLSVRKSMWSGRGSTACWAPKQGEYANAHDNRHERHKKLGVVGVTGSLLSGIEIEVVA